MVASVGKDHSVRLVLFPKGRYPDLHNAVAFLLCSRPFQMDVCYTSGDMEI